MILNVTFGEIGHNGQSRTYRREYGAHCSFVSSAQCTFPFHFTSVLHLCYDAMQCNASRGRESEREIETYTHRNALLHQTASCVLSTATAICVFPFRQRTYRKKKNKKKRSKMNAHFPLHGQRRLARCCMDPNHTFVHIFPPFEDCIIKFSLSSQNQFGMPHSLISVPAIFHSINSCARNLFLTVFCCWLADQIFREHRDTKQSILHISTDTF